MKISQDYKLLIYGPAMNHIEAEPVTPEDYQDLPLLRRYMGDVLRMTRGVGLSAPQVGVFKSFIVVMGDGGVVTDLVNPQVTRMYGKEIEEWEACLSLPPDANGCLVPRMESVDILAASAAHPDTVKARSFHRFTARVVQHELDHLTGTFFVDRASEKNRRIVLERFNAWKFQRSAQVRKPQKGKENVDAGIVAAAGAASRLS